MTSQVPVTVIVPTWDRAAVLPRALHSIFAQSRQPAEVIVVDDGSKDHTQSVLDMIKRVAEGTRLRRVLTENRGVSAARNSGIAFATQPWIAFLDSDDEWLPRKLERQFTEIDKTGLSVVHGDEIWIRNGRRVNPRQKHKKRGGWILPHCFPLCCISPSAVMMHRSVFERVGLFREDYPVCEDYDLWIRICARYEVAFVESQVLTKYGGHADQLSRRYAAMDYWRCKTLAWALENLVMNDADRSHAVSILGEKIAVLRQGASKRQNLEILESVEHWDRAFPVSV